MGRNGENGARKLIVDSAGWVEFFGEGPKADAFEPYLCRQAALLVPTIVVYEVYKKLLSTRGATIAQRFLSAAWSVEIVPLDMSLATAAAAVSFEHKLAMADAIIYATALDREAELVTSDQAFRELPGVTLL